MSGRSARVWWLVTLAAFPFGSLLLDGCGQGARHAGGRNPSGADTSFMTLTSRPGRSSFEISVAGGRVVYDRYCAICHGETGGGDGFNAYNVKAAYDVNPAAFSDSTFMASLGDSVALAAIRSGGSAIGKSAGMPPWGHTLTEGEMADVWHYARSLVSAVHP